MKCYNLQPIYLIIIIKDLYYFIINWNFCLNFNYFKYLIFIFLNFIY